MTMQTAQARAEGMGQLVLSVEVTDATYSDPQFFIGGVRFLANGFAVSPAIVSWGTFQGGITSDMAGEGGGSVMLDGNAYLIPILGTTRLTVSEWLRQTNWRDAPAILYQCNTTEGSPEVVWRGYVIGVTGSRFVDGAYQVELMLSALLRDLDRIEVSDLITKATFSGSPTGSLGNMVPRFYGRADNLLSATDIGGGLARVGFAMSGARGIVIDEQQSTAKVKVRFSKNDATSAWSSFPTATSDDASTYGGLWIYDSGMGCYGMVDNASYTVTNGVNYTEVVVDATPKVFFYFRPKQIGSTNAAGFTDSYKIIDSDSTNYVTSTGADYSWGFYMPSVNFGGRIKSLGVVVDWQNAHAAKSRKIQFGIWDIYQTAGANWLGGSARLLPAATRTKLSGDPRIIMQQSTATYRYEQSSFGGGGAAGAHKGSGTKAEFSSGSFITYDTGDANIATLEIRVLVEDLGGLNAGTEDVRLYNVGMFVEVDYAIPPRRVSAPQEVGPLTVTLTEDQGSADRRIREAKQSALARSSSTDFFARGAAQKDDGSGTFTGSAAAVIERVPDIAHHLLVSVCGESANTTAGTLGNFVDPRTNGVLKDLKIMAPFGPNVVKRKAALEQLTRRFPISLRRTKSESWHCIPDDLNPHSSTVYRSTSEPIWITANDIEAASFSDREMDVSEIVNSVQLNYSHGYPDREALASTTYNNNLSQKWFGLKSTDPYDYPEIQQTDLSAATDQKATDMAQWLGRRSARPRRIVTCSLFQKFYDLEPGHTLGFTGLENIGIPVQAFRSGLLDYYFNSSAGGTDYADSSATVLISLTDTAVLIGLSQQTDQITFSIQTAAAFTSVANAWRYSSSAGFSNFSGVTNTNALKSTGTQTVTWTLPNWWEWIKSEQTLGGTTYGPCYWIYFSYSVPTVAGLANARTTYPATWKGRYFKVLSAARRPGRRSKDYPYMDAILMEVM